MAVRVGGATVEVNADLSKLLSGLDKAKQTAKDFTQSAGQQMASFVNTARVAANGVTTLAANSQAAALAMRVFGTATRTTTAAVTTATASMTAYANATPAVARAVTGIGVAATGMAAAVTKATTTLQTTAQRSPFIANVLKTVGVAAAGITAAFAAAGAGIASYAEKSPLFGRLLTGVGVAAAGVAAGFKNVAAFAGPALAAAWRFAMHPLGIFALSAATGAPVMGAAMAIASTRAGPAIGRGLLAAGGFAMRSPLAAVGVGLGGVGLGIAAVSGIAHLASSSFGTLVDAFKETRKASADLKAEMEALNTAASALVRQMPRESQLTTARLEALRNVTGGDTSPFAQANAGQISSTVTQWVASEEILQRLAMRTGDVQKAFDLLSQSLRNPARAMSLLTDQGIVFTEQETQMLASTRTLNDRLENAGRVVEILNRQLARTREESSGWTQLMWQIGTFLGNIPNAIGSTTTSALSALVRGIVELTGLTPLVNALDQAFRSLGERIRQTNVRLFGGAAADQLQIIRQSIAEIDRDLETFRQRAATIDRSGFLGGIAGRVVDERIAMLEQQRRLLTGESNRLEADEFTRQRLEREERERRLNTTLEERIRLLHEELELMQAGNRQQLDAFRFAQQYGVSRDDPRVAEVTRLNRQIENRRRIIAQADQLSVFDRENQRLTQQIQLFRYGNDELQIRNHLLQLEIQAAQRRQPLNEEQRQQLLQQLRVQQQIKDITSAIDNAFTSTFNAMGDALAQFASTGKFKFKEMADSIVQQLVRIAFQASVIKPLMNAITGVTNPAVANLVSPGSTTSPIQIPQAGGFAEGGSFTVPGGRTGDQPYLVGLSAGERVDITPARGRQGERGVTINNVINSSKDFEVQTREREHPDGSRVIEQVFSEVSKRIGRGDMDGTFGARFGMRPRSIQR